MGTALFFDVNAGLNMADFVLGAPFAIEIIDSERICVTARAGMAGEIKLAFTKEEVVGLATMLIAAAANLPVGEPKDGLSRVH